MTDHRQGSSPGNAEWQDSLAWRRSRPWSNGMQNDDYTTRTLAG
jgi:hypothetical protein